MKYELGRQLRKEVPKIASKAESEKPAYPTTSGRSGPFAWFDGAADIVAAWRGDEVCPIERIMSLILGGFRLESA